MDTIEERKAFLTKDIDELKFRYNGELSLAIEGRFTNLRIWIGNEKCLADGGGKRQIFMRLDKYNDYSVPFNAENFKYLQNPPKGFDKLLKFGFQSDIENLDEILEITKKLKYRKLREW